MSSNFILYFPSFILQYNNPITNANTIKIAYQCMLIFDICIAIFETQNCNPKPRK